MPRRLRPRRPRHQKPAPQHQIKHSSPPPPSLDKEAISFVGCFADDAQHDVGEADWRAAFARGKMTTTQCAITCSDSAWFAMQRGRCQCVSSFGTGPSYKLLPDSSAECGPVCPGEESAPGPPRYCGGDAFPADAASALSASTPARNAIYTQTSCFLGGKVEVQDTKSLGRSDEGQLLWRGRVRLERFAEGATVTLDWGRLPVEMYSLWGANFAVKDAIGARGPKVVLALKGTKVQEIGFKVRGGAGDTAVLPRLTCTPKLHPPPPPPRPPRSPVPPLPPLPPPPPSACTGASIRGGSAGGAGGSVSGTLRR